MRIPNADTAVVDMAKLRDYCLSLQHPRGRHKARVFASALGLTADRAEVLRDALLVAVRTGEAAPTEADGYGQRYVLDFTMVGAVGRATVRSHWIVRHDEAFPRLVSCYGL